MRRCERCGESNPADAAFCATCGLQLGEVGGLAALAETPDTPDPTTDRSTEWVEAPAFGETGTPGAPPGRAAATETAAMPTAPRPVAPTAVGAPDPVTDSRSTNVMIAALAVAIVVIVGGIAVLLTSNGGGEDTARTADTVETAASTSSTTVAASESTAVATVVEQPPATDAPTEPEPTPAPTSGSAVSTRGPGDLGLPQPILDEACDGRYITFVGSAVGAVPYAEEVAMLLAQYPDSNYIWTRACPSLRQEFRDGNDIYGVVFGPYLTQGEACDAVAFGPPDAYVRRISTTDPEDHTVEC